MIPMALSVGMSPFSISLGHWGLIMVSSERDGSEKQAVLAGEAPRDDVAPDVGACGWRINSAKKADSVYR